MTKQQASRGARSADIGSRQDHDDPEDPGAYIGRLPERVAATIPGGIGPKDRRVAGIASQPGPTSPDTEVPGGHRQGPRAADETVREAGQDR